MAINFLNNPKVGDDVKIEIGSSSDLQIYHDGSNSFINNGTGNITIENSQNDGDIIFRSDNGSGGTATYFFIDGGNEATRFYKDTWHSDSKKALFGNGTDLQIYHDGNSKIETSTGSAGDLYIKSQGSGHDLYLQATDDVFIRPQGGENGIKVIGNGAVELYHNNAKKIETTTVGVEVTGNIVSETTSGNSGIKVITANTAEGF